VATFRFGVFELDLEERELRKQGRRIKLQEKPFETLALLLEHTGEIVSRDQLRDRLWPADTFVQFDDNLNSAIKRVREALGDSAESPRYVETVPRRGYRFVPPVERVPFERVKATPDAIPNPPPARRPTRQLALAAGLTAALLLIALAGLLPTRAGRNVSGRPILAVLPFRNLSGDPAQEYLCDGMTELLIAHIGRLNPKSLGVIARSSVMGYKAAPQDVRKIAAELEVAYVLEGSVRSSGGRIAITAQLIEPHGRTHVWSETYDRPAADLFVVQRDVARGIAEALAIRLLPEQEPSLARASTTNTEAYDAYLKGLQEWHRGTKESFKAAAGAFERAAALDPNFALAHDGAARAYLSLTDYRFLPSDEAFRKARQQVEIALGLDPTIPQTIELSAELLDKTDPNATGADEAYRGALELNPSDAYTQRTYGMYLLGKHRNPEAIGHILEAVRLDPLSPSTLTYAAYTLYRTNDRTRSQEQVKRALTLDPNFPFALYVQGHLYEDDGRLADSITAFQKAVNSSGHTPKYLYALAKVCTKAGRRPQAESILHELEAQSANGYVPPEFIEGLSKDLRASRVPVAGVR
jgi:TolB-like protein/DNA-binding winged helix-turn-helix (wHTH) protein/Tfp pilus assembly protein PilF